MINSPKEIATLYLTVGKSKTEMQVRTLFLLGILAAVSGDCSLMAL